MPRRDDVLPEENLVKGILESLDKDVSFLVRHMAPNGRAPFQVKLTKTEQEERLKAATPEDIKGWAAPLANIPNKKERRSALSDLFTAYAEAQMQKMVDDGILSEQDLEAQEEEAKYETWP